MKYKFDIFKENDFFNVAAPCDPTAWRCLDANDPDDATRVRPTASWQIPDFQQLHSAVAIVLGSARDAENFEALQWVPEQEVKPNEEQNAVIRNIELEPNELCRVQF